MSEHQNQEFRTHRLLIKGKSSIYQVRILENSKVTMSDCNCGKHKCYHILQVLTGNTTNLVSEEDIATQKRIIDSLNTTERGRKKLAKVARLVSKNKSCPNCYGSKIKVYKRSFIATEIFGLLQRYECLTCNHLWKS